MSTISLSVADRLVLKNLLPDRGSMAEMTVVDDLMSQINFTADEVVEFELENIPGSVIKYNSLKSRDTDINLNGPALALLKDIPIKVDSMKQVTVVMIPLLKKLQAL